MPQVAYVVKSLEQLKSRLDMPSDSASHRAMIDACQLLLKEIRSLRDRLSLRAYMELYEQFIALEQALGEKSVIGHAGAVDLDGCNETQIGKNPKMS